MRIHSTRKLFLFGRYSLALLIPKKWLRALEIGRGDGVEMELDRKRKRIVLRFDKSLAVTVEETKKNPEQAPNNQNGLEPIPPLD